MKNKFTTFLFLIITIPSFGQNIEKNRDTKLLVERLPTTDIKPVKNNYHEQYWNEIKYKVCYDICEMGRCQPDPNLLYIRHYGVVYAERYKYLPLKEKVKILNGTETSAYSSCANNYSITIPKNANKEIKKRYIALTERHNSRYPNNKTQKTPELQSNLQEIRF
ncbi:MAG: hypothetical protein ACI85O_002453 [Saprospiraceae bacterium]|jgi:hypothetical protein